MTAANDPFVPSQPFHDPAITGNPHITVVITNEGGHCAFLERAEGDYDGYWSEREIVRFATAHVHFGGIRLQLAQRIVNRYAQNHQLVSVILLELDEGRNFLAARSAPRCPEVQQDHLALERGQLDVDPVHVLHRELQRRRFTDGKRVSRGVGINRRRALTR